MNNPTKIIKKKKNYFMSTKYPHKIIKNINLLKVNNQGVGDRHIGIHTIRDHAP